MSKTTRQFFVETIKDELPRFERLFKALPKAKLGWKPHDRSGSALQISLGMALEAMTLPIILKTGKIDFAHVMPKMPKSFDEGVRVFKSQLLKTKNMASKMSEKEWSKKAIMMSGDKLEWTTTKGGMVWSFILDAIHHRGQLSSYIRPMGGKVPSIYGPSGDSK